MFELFIIWVVLSIPISILIGRYLRKIRKEQTWAIDVQDKNRDHYLRSDLPADRWGPEDHRAGMQMREIGQRSTAWSQAQP